MRAAVLFAGLLLCGIMSNISAQTVYKWVDGDAVTHFSAQPPQGIDAERTSIRLRSTNRQATQTLVENSTAQREADTVRRQQNQEKAAENKAQTQKDFQTRAENCAKARQQNETYSTARRLYRELEDGEREYLDDAELDAERAEAKQLVDNWCD